MFRPELSRTVFALIIILNLIAFSCTNVSNKEQQKTHQEDPPALIKNILDTVYRNDSLNIHFAIPLGWEGLSLADISKFKIISDAKFLFGAKKKKSHFLITDRVFDPKKTNYENYVRNAGDSVLIKNSSIKIPGLIGQLQPPFKKEIGGCIYDILVYKLSSVRTHKILLTEMLYFRLTLSGHAMMGVLICPPEDVKDIENSLLCGK